MKDVHKIFYRTSSSPAGNIPEDMRFKPVDGVVTSSDIDQSRCLNMISFESLREISDNIGLNTYRAYWYNAQGRLVQMLEKTSDGWISRYSTKYDFVGNVTAYCEQHADPSGVMHELLTRNDYDERSRLIKSVRTLDGKEYHPVNYTYDVLGRPCSKSQGGINETAQLDILGRKTGIRITDSYGRVSFDENIRYRFDGLINQTTINNGQREESIVKNLYIYDRMGRLSGNRRWVDNTETEVGTERAMCPS